MAFRFALRRPNCRGIMTNFVTFLHQKNPIQQPQRSSSVHSASSSPLFASLKSTPTSPSSGGRLTKKKEDDPRYIPKINDYVLGYILDLKSSVDYALYFIRKDQKLDSIELVQVLEVMIVWSFKQGLIITMEAIVNNSEKKSYEVHVVNGKVLSHSMNIEGWRERYTQGEKSN